MASITLANYAVALPAPAYKISKAAMNALTVQYALEYEKEGFTIFSLSPGWLRTDLGGEQGELTVEEGAAASLKLIAEAGKEQNGQFTKIYIDEWETKGYIHKYDGVSSPW